jgi:hypothetical protein
MTIGFEQLTSNDTDVEGDALTVSAVRDRANGHASIVNGQVQFVANTGFTGAASFDYLADDGRGGQAWATAYVDVKQPPNLYPTAFLTGGNGSGRYPYMYWVQNNFEISDDTADSAAAVGMQLVSAKFRTPESASYDYHGTVTYSGGWVDASSSYSISRTGSSGFFIFNGVFDLLQTEWLLMDY